MENVRQIWEETVKKLRKLYERREAENIAYLLFEDVLGIRKSSILSQDMKQLDKEALQNATYRLLEGEPLQYVSGIADFYGRQFRLAQGALIPRPETEELCALIIKENDTPNPTILDVGTGSGCIAITLALEIGGEVMGSDVSNDALEIARHNSSHLGANVNFICHDILNEYLQIEQMDILVSNPPYIPEKEKPFMNRNVLDFEPESALFVPNDDPLLFYREIGRKGTKALKSGGRIYFEIHEDFGKEVVEVLITLGYQSVEVFQDMQGKNRMVRGIR